MRERRPPYKPLSPVGCLRAAGIPTFIFLACLLARFGDIISNVFGENVRDVLKGAIVFCLLICVAERSVLGRIVGGIICVVAAFVFAGNYWLIPNFLTANQTVVAGEVDTAIGITALFAVGLFSIYELGLRSPLYSRWEQKIEGGQPEDLKSLPPLRFHFNMQRRREEHPPGLPEFIDTSLPSLLRALGAKVKEWNSIKRNGISYLAIVLDRGEIRYNITICSNSSDLGEFNGEISLPAYSDADCLAPAIGYTVLAALKSLPGSSNVGPGSYFTDRRYARFRCAPASLSTSHQLDSGIRNRRGFVSEILISCLLDEGFNLNGAPKTDGTYQFLPLIYKGSSITVTLSQESVAPAYWTATPLVLSGPSRKKMTHSELNRLINNALLRSELIHEASWSTVVHGQEGWNLPQDLILPVSVWPPPIDEAGKTG
jgi:hypothetical protein